MDGLEREIEATIYDFNLNNMPAKRTAKRIMALIAKKDGGSKVPCSVGLGREPLRIECGQGKVGVYDGDVDGLPCLTLGNDGTGVIGEPTGRELPSAIPKEVELVTVTFANIESADVFIRALLRIKERL